jgi:hypothetical protein
MISVALVGLQMVEGAWLEDDFVLSHHPALTVRSVVDSHTIRSLCR